jgi:hypothetical protein
MNKLTIEELIEKIENGEISDVDKEALLKQFTKIMREINNVSKEFLSDNNNK